MSQFTYREVCKIIKAAKTLGVVFLELDGLKVVFKKPKKPKKESVPQPQMFGKVADLTAEELFKPPAHLDNLTEEEILYYATPHFDELQAEKERTRKLKEEAV